MSLPGYDEWLDNYGNPGIQEAEMSDTNDEYNWGNHPDTDMNENKNKPTLIVLAQLRGGMLVRAEWSGLVVQLSDKTLGGMRALGIDIIDDENNYLFKADML